MLTLSGVMELFAEVIYCLINSPKGGQARMTLSERKRRANLPSLIYIYSYHFNIYPTNGPS